MNRSELVSAVAKNSSVPNGTVDSVLSALQEVITSSVAGGEKVTVTGFLSAERTERAERTGRNPRTGEEIQIPAGFAVKLTPGSQLKNAVKA